MESRAFSAAVCLAVVLFAVVGAQLQYSQIAASLTANGSPSPTYMLLILREKCLCWRAQGLNPLPEYCLELFQNPLIVSSEQLYKDYGHYRQAVPTLEQVQDYVRVQSLLSTAVQDGVWNTLEKILHRLSTTCTAKIV